MKSMKLTPERLKSLILEVLEEHQNKTSQNIPFRNDYEAEEHLQKQQQRHAKERAQREEISIVPGSLKALAKGVLQEGDLIDDLEADAKDGFVKIRRSALKRLLLKEGQNLQRACNKIGYKSLKQWLVISDAFSDASKGKYGDPKKK